MSTNKVRTLVCSATLLLSWPTHAAEDNEETALPDIEFLEFLGTWQDDGKWVDPMQFRTRSDNENEQPQTEEQAHE